MADSALRSTAIGAALLPLLSLVAAAVFITAGGPRVQARSTAKAAPEIVAVEACAARAVYWLARYDDYGLRAVIANAELNRAHLSAPGIAASPCGYPPPHDDAGGTPDPYRWQSALDAVDAVARGQYEVPAACAGASVVLSAMEAPRAVCVYADLAFVGAAP